MRRFQTTYCWAPGFDVRFPFNEVVDAPVTRTIHLIRNRQILLEQE